MCGLFAFSLLQCVCLCFRGDSAVCPSHSNSNYRVLSYSGFTSPSLNLHVRDVCSGFPLCLIFWVSSQRRYLERSLSVGVLHLHTSPPLVFRNLKKFFTWILLTHMYSIWSFFFLFSCKHWFGVYFPFFLGRTHFSLDCRQLSCPTTSTLSTRQEKLYFLLG